MPRHLLLIAFALAAAGGAPKLLADADGDGKLSAAEYITSRREVVMAMDVNGDRRVSRSEWTRRAPGVKDAGEAALFEDMDRDGDGSVNATEADGAARAHFTRLDRDRDGLLAGPELGGLLAQSAR